MTYLNHARIRLLTVAGRDSYGLIHKDVDLAPHPVVGLVLQVGDAEKCPHALGSESLDLFSRASQGERQVTKSGVKRY